MMSNLDYSNAEFCSTSGLQYPENLVGYLQICNYFSKIY